MRTADVIVNVTKSALLSVYQTVNTVPAIVLTSKHRGRNTTVVAINKDKKSVH